MDFYQSQKKHFFEAFDVSKWNRMMKDFWVGPFSLQKVNIFSIVLQHKLVSGFNHFL